MNRSLAVWPVVLCAALTYSMAANSQVQFQDVFAPQDFTSALSEAQSRRIPLYLLYSSSSCPACRIFSSRVLSDSATVEFLDLSFVTVSFTPSDPKFDSLKAVFRLTGLPTHVIINPDGTLRHLFVGVPHTRISDSTGRGYRYLAEYRRVLDRALSATQNLGHLISVREKRQLDNTELLDFAYGAKNATATYPWDGYHRKIVRGASEIVEDYFSRLTPDELVSDSGRAAIRYLMYRIDSEVSKNILKHAQEWAKRLGPWEVADVILTILENDVETRFGRSSADSATLVNAVSTIRRLQSELSSEKEQSLVEDRLCRALTIAEREDLCPSHDRITPPPSADRPTGG